MGKRRRHANGTADGARTMEAIVTIATHMSAASDPLEVLARLTQALIAGLGYAGGALFLDHPRVHAAEVLATLPLLPLTDPVSAAPAVAEVLAGNLVGFAHGAFDTRLPSVLRQLVRASHGEGGLLLPLQARGRMLGMLALYDHTPGAPHGSRRRLTASFAAFVAMAFAQASAAHATRQHDVSATEEALTKSRLLAAAERERRLRDAVLDVTNEGILLVAADGRILLTNAALHRLLNIPTDRAPLDIVDFCAWLAPRLHDAEGFCRLIERAMAEKEPLSGEMVLLLPHRRECVVLATPVRLWDGSEIGRLITLDDVTEARAADRVKSEFVALASHELRSPIHIILGYLELLLDGRFGPLTAQQREHLALVMASGQQLAFLVNDLLDLSRLQQGQLTLHRTPVNISAVCHDVVCALAPQAVAHRQKLHLDLPHEPLMMSGDYNRLSQVVRNLVDNALKYTPDGGTITVRAWDRDGWATIEVRDTGIGINPDEQVRLFTRFFRVDNEMTRKTTGTGLGLAITRAIVELHGGTITVESQRGSGSVFRVVLPRTESVHAISHALTR